MNRTNFEAITKRSHSEFNLEQADRKKRNKTKRGTSAKRDWKEAV